MEPFILCPDLGGHCQSSWVAMFHLPTPSSKQNNNHKGLSRWKLFCITSHSTEEENSHPGLAVQKPIKGTGATRSPYPVRKTALLPIRRKAAFTYHLFPATAASPWVVLQSCSSSHFLIRHSVSGSEVMAVVLQLFQVPKTQGYTRIVFFQSHIPPLNGGQHLFRAKGFARVNHMPVFFSKLQSVRERTNRT